MRRESATNLIPHCPRKAGVRSFGCHARFFVVFDHPSLVSLIRLHAEGFDRPASHATHTLNLTDETNVTPGGPGRGQARGVGRFLRGLARCCRSRLVKLRFSFAPTVDHHRPWDFSIPAGTWTRRLAPVMERP